MKPLAPIAIAAITALATTGQALALSCVPPDVARSFVEAQKSDKAYVVVHGRLSYDTALLPSRNRADINDMPPRTTLSARLTGKALTRSGFTADFDVPVKLEIHCWGPWCSGTSPDIDQLLFVEKTEAGYVFAAEPCGQFEFAEPTQRQLGIVRNCMRGRSCEPRQKF